MKCPFELHNRGNGRKVILENFKDQEVIEQMGQKMVTHSTFTKVQNIQ